MEVGTPPDAVVIYLSKVSGSERPNGQTGKLPNMFSRRLVDAHEYSSLRNAEVDPIQCDSGSNQFVRFRDLEGNELEVCQET
jgi:hypothetical protein